MTNTAGKVISGKPVATGGVLSAPVGTALPTAANGAIDEDFVPHGYVTEDGVTKSESRDTNEIKEWGGLTVKKSQTGFEATFQFAFLEYLNAGAAKTIYGDDAVSVTPANGSHGEQIAIAVSGQEAPHRAWIFDMADGLTKTKVCIGDGQITEVGDTSYSVDGAATRDVTITVYPDSEGVLYTELTDDGVLSA
jgi:hypothetical protein